MPSRQPSPAAQFSAMLSRFSPEIVALAKRCLPRIRRAAPWSHQLVYDYTNSVLVAFGMSERSYEAIVSLGISPRGVRLYFDRSLPAPKRLLQGSGTKVRSMTVSAASDLDHADVQALFKAAMQHAAVPATRGGSPRVVIKSAAKKPAAKQQRPGRRRLASKG